MVPFFFPYYVHMDFELLRLRGAEARQYETEIARLRLKVFWEFPYLYEGTLDYERDYLDTYFKAEHSFILLVRKDNRVIGVTTAIWAPEEVESFQKPFLEHGIDPDSVCYFGESILLAEYRGKGLGKIFFQERERFARTLPMVSIASFCAVVRPVEHPLRPPGYRSLDEFWETMGYRKVPDLVTGFEWKDRDKDYPDRKDLQFWMKNL